MRVALSFAMLCVLAPAAARAQDVPPAPPGPGVHALGLRDALRRARDHAPQVLAAMARYEASRAQVDVTRSALWPTLSTTVAASAAVSQSTAQTFASGLIGGGTVTSSFGATGSLDGRWTIWDFGRTDEATRAARSESNAAGRDVDDVRRAAMQAVAAAFFGVLADQQIIATNAAIAEQRGAELRIAQGLVEVGTRPPIEQTRAQVSLASAQLDLRVSQGNLASDVASLAAALAFDPAVPLVVVTPTALDVVDDPARAADAAVRARPDMRAALLRVEEARANVRLARAAWMPTLSASVSAVGRLSDIPQAMTPSSATGTVSAGLTFTAPLVDESISARTRAAEAQLGAQEEALAQLELQVRSTAVQAAVSVRNARAALDQSEELARQAAANLAQAEGRYQTGAAPLLELVDAEAADASARLGVVRLRAALELSKAQLLAVTGRLDGLAR